MKKSKPLITQLQALRRGYLIRCTECKKVVPNRLVCLWCGAWVGNDYYSVKKPSQVSRNLRNFNTKETQTLYYKKERKQMSPSILVSAVEWFR